jgi:hypothetical protein
VDDARTGDSPDYLARDYASFRALMLEHLAVRMPAGVAGEAGSLEVALVEVLAYIADYLSYYQDAVATEAYLTTARERISVRRHARLLDYRVNEGCSARTWVHLETAADGVPVPQGTALLVAIPGIDAVAVPAGFEMDGLEAFETMHDALLTRACNRMSLFEPDEPLQAGATGARLAGSLPIAVGDVLVFQHAVEACRHAVRLTGISAGDGPSTAVDWHDDDELPADIPASGPWIVLGNIVLADHGLSVEQDLPAVTPEGNSEVSVPCPRLAHASPYRHAEAARRSAADAMRQDPRAAEPAMWLKETASFLGAEAAGQRPLWTGRREIVHATQFDRSFAVEPEGGDSVGLRFGNGVHARRLQPDWRYRLRYRAGQGVQGNIGPNTLAHIVTDDDRIVGVTNPIAAGGGADPESIDDVRASAPHASGHQRRCVSAADYVEMTNRFAEVQASLAERASPREGGAVSIHVRRRGDRPIDTEFSERLRDHLAPFLLIGDELRIAGAVYVRPILAIEIAVDPGWGPASVADAVRARLGELAFGFGEALERPRLIACARGVAGVADAWVTAPARARIEVAPSEIIRFEPASIAVTMRAVR